MTTRRPPRPPSDRSDRPASRSPRSSSTGRSTRSSATGPDGRQPRADSGGSRSNDRRSANDRRAERGNDRAIDSKGPKDSFRSHAPRPRKGAATTADAPRSPSARGRPSDADRGRPASADRSRPASAGRGRPDNADRGRPASADRGRPASADRSRPTSADRSRPASADRSRPTSADRSRPASADRSRPASADRSRPPSAEVGKAKPVRKPLARAAAVAAASPEDAFIPGEPQRISKILARAGVGSRRDVERMIDEGRISLNGEILSQPAPLLQSLEGLTVDGEPVAKPVSTRLYRFYKPTGCLTAARDPKGRKTIYDVMPAGLPRLMPVGRLDFNTEGLLLLTNDGEFKRQLELPSSGIERTYRARAFGEVSQSQLEELAMGVEIEGIRYGKIDANLERRTGANQWIEMTLTEGKNREVRRVLEHLDLQVNRLIRVRYGDFTIADLDTGDVDMVARDALFQFRRHLK